MSPSDFKENKRKFVVTVKETEISWFTRGNELIFVLVKIKCGFASANA